MRFQAPKQDLLRIISRAAAVTDSKGTMPILGNIKLTADSDALHGSLRAEATDLYLAFCDVTPADVDAGGSICLPARDLLDRLKAMPEGNVSFVAEGTTVTVKAVGKSRRFTVHGFPGDEFPSIPSLNGQHTVRVTLSAPELLKALTSTAFSVSTDITRVHLNSLLVHVDSESAFRFVSTDGHRLSLFTFGKDPDTNANEWLLPLRGVAELKKLASEFKTEKVTLTQAGANLFASIGDLALAIKLVDATFPPFQQVIPETSDHTVTLDRVAFADAVRAVGISANHTGGVKLTFRNSLCRIESSAPDKGDGFDEVPCDFNGKELSIGVNKQYLVEALGAIGSESVSLGVSGELDPVVVRSATETEDRYLGVVMPMRI